MRNKLKSFRRWLMNHPEVNEEETTKYLRDRSLFGLLDFINAVYEYYDYRKRISADCKQQAI